MCPNLVRVEVLFAALVLLLFSTSVQCNSLFPVNTETLRAPGSESDASLLIADNIRQVVWLASDGNGIRRLNVAANSTL
jgi:hypothetical protein